MLVNFCDRRLCPKIGCNTISTEGYEITNLINNSCKGFLAYSCIKPPVHIDIIFMCNIKINHVLIWPAVGAQKSSGFQLYSRTDDTSCTLLSTGYLNPCDNGLLFYPADVDLRKISTPENFLKRYIKVSKRNLTTNTAGLRISICKTQNSVPALGKIEVWGTVSASCKTNIMKNVYALWSQYEIPLFTGKCETATTSTDITCNRNVGKSILEIPEEFLDAITWELMTQPIVLPSGKIIDRTTLEQYERNEAVWGRPISDPFTNLPFYEQRKPIVAAALKLRIDRFLLENSNAEEIKKLPRVLGHSLAAPRTRDRRIEISDCFSKNLLGKKTANDIKVNKRVQATNTPQRIKRHCHQLPAIVPYPKQSPLNCNTRSKQMTKAFNTCIPHYNSAHIQNQIEVPEVLMNNTDSSRLLSNIKHFSTPEKLEYGVYCNHNILYRLPCKHVVSREMLLSIKNNQCKSCGSLYKSSDVERTHIL